MSSAVKLQRRVIGNHRVRCEPARKKKRIDLEVVW